MRTLEKFCVVKVKFMFVSRNISLLFILRPFLFMDMKRKPVIYVSVCLSG